MRFWTHYWTHETAVYTTSQGSEPTRHTAGNRFLSRGVEPGDRVYIISFWENSMRLLGRIDVERIVGFDEAWDLLGYEPWDAPEQILGNESSAAPSLKIRDLTKSQLKRVEFINKGNKPAFVVKNKAGNIEPGSFRAVRELTEDTARKFDSILGVP